MTRKDYERMARMIRDRLAIIRKMDGDSEWRRGAFDALALLARDYADDAERDNPRFDRKRFMTACGLTENAHEAAA